MMLNRPTGQAIIATSGSAITESTITLVNEWLDWCKADGDASVLTLAAYRKGLDVFTGWLRDNPANAGIVTAGDILRYKGWLKDHPITDKNDVVIGTYSVQTVNLRLTAVRSFYRWMVNTDRLQFNPAAQVKGLKRSDSQTHKRDALTNSEILAVLDVCKADQSLAGVRDLAIITYMAFSGARGIELQRADIKDQTTKGNRMILWVQGKGHTEKDDFVVVPYSQEGVMRHWLSHRLTFADHAGDGPLFVSLSNRNRGERLTTRAIRAIVKDRYKQAGVAGDRKTTHSLRHSCITSVILNKGSVMQAQAMARHRDPKTTLIYFHAVSRIENPAEDLVNYEGVA